MKRGAPLRRFKTLRAGSFAALKPLQIQCCGKKRFATLESAEAALLRISRTTPDEEYPQYAYECPDGWWHLTRKKPWAKPARGKAPRDTGPDLHVKAIVDERDDWHCAACGNSVWGRPYSRQHRVARGMGGTSDPRLNAPSNIVLLCGSATSPGGCHLLCEQRDEGMHERGFWLKNSQRPWLEPVEHKAYGRVYLLDEERPDGSRVMPASDLGGDAP